MSQFEFIFILVSIILGLALANLLGGVARLSKKSWRQVDGIHLAFSLGVILAIFVVWWGMYRWQDHGQFEFETFVVIGLYTSVFYSLSVILFPRDGSLVGFDDARKSFYLALILLQFLELAYYAVGDFDPPDHYAFVWIFSLAAFTTSIWLKQRWLDRLIAVYWFVLFSGWWLVTKF